MFLPTSILKCMKNGLFSVAFFLFTGGLSTQPNIQWAKAFGGTGADEAYSIQQTPDGGYVVAGPSPSHNGDVFGNHGGLDFWVLKLDNNGLVKWKKTYGGSTDEQAYAVKSTSDKGCIVVGYTLSNDEDVLGNHGYYDAWVLKLDSTGAIQWQKCLGGSDWEEANDVQQTKDGGYVVVGRSRSTDGDVTVNHGYLDYWIVNWIVPGALNGKSHTVEVQRIMLMRCNKLWMEGISSVESPPRRMEM